MTAVPFKPSKWTLLFLLLSAMMILMGGAAVAPALPLISKAFPDTSESLISLIITLPALAIALTGFFIGGLSDKFGKVRILVASVAVFTIAGSSGFYLNSIPALLIGRFILGMGIAGITCTTSSLIGYYYEGITRAKVLGYQAAAMGLGVLILETSGGFLAGISWRVAFLIYLIGFVILAGVLATMKEPERLKCEKTIDMQEQVFPALPLLFAYITLFIGNMFFFLMPTKFPFLLVNMDVSSVFWGNSALASGLFLGMSGCASSLFGVLYGRIAWRFHRYTILTITFTLFGIGLCSIGFATSLFTVAIGVICIGIGEGILMPTILNWIAVMTPKQFLGRASGGFSVALNLGQFASTLVIVPVFAVVVTYSNAFVAFGCLAFVLALPYLLALLKNKYGISVVVACSKVNS